MKKYLLLLMIFSFSNILNAQDMGCENGRYIDDVFDEIKVTKGLKFGEGETITGNFKELFLDVYEPVGDELEQRPVIILAFGGSFIGGAREDLEGLCTAYARKGYVAVTIDYRLFDGPLLPLPNAAQMKIVVIKSVSDMKAAIRYMREDADTENLFRIDPNRVLVGGISAGSITAFHTAALDESDDIPEDIQTALDDNGGIEGNSSTNFEYSSDVVGLINFSGGLNDASWIDANDPPFVSVHDDMDQVVPYGSGFATIGGIPIVAMDGSQRCQEVGDSVGIENQLLTIENSLGHVSYILDPVSFAEAINFSADFMADIVCADISIDTEDRPNLLESISVYPNPSNGLVNISHELDTDYSIDLMDIYGRKLNSFYNTTTLDLSDYANGIYFIRINNQKTVKLIIEK